MFAWPLPGAGYRTWLTVAAPMTQRLSPGTAAMLAAAPLLWAGNAVVGRALHTLIAPSTLNFLRWLLAFALLLPLAWQVLRPASGLWPHWRRYAALGLFGIGSYNALQYLALQTSTALNVTLVEDLHFRRDALPSLEKVLAQADRVYLTIDLDVLPAGEMPAVSAPAALGIPALELLPVIERICRSGKLQAADLVEFNPHYDRDGQGARLAARLAWQIAHWWA